MKLSEIKEGDVLRADDGFDCIANGAVLTVCVNTTGELYVQCTSGTHFLDGQVGEDGEVVGFTRFEATMAQDGVGGAGA